MPNCKGCSFENKACGVCATCLSSVEESRDNMVAFSCENHGFKICGNCNGYGSSLREESDVCSECGGTGIIKTRKKQ